MKISARVQQNALYTMLRMFFLSGWVFAVSHPVARADDEVRYEITSGTSIVSEEHTQDDYVVVGVSYPDIRAERERDYYDINSDFYFFFTPISDDNSSLPIALRRFYAHSSTLHFSATIEPKHTASYTFVNPDLNVRTTSEDDEQLRQTNVDGLFFVTPNSGLRLRVTSTKDEQVSFETSPSIEVQSQDDTNEIRRTYGIGLLEYPSEHIALTIDYAYHDNELHSLEKSWQDNPLVFSEVERTTATTGHALSLEGEYIWQNRFGFQLAYEYFVYESDSDVQTIHLENFDGGSSTFSDDGTQQTITPMVRLYVGEKFMMQCSGSLIWTTVTRTYDETTDVKYIWNWWQVQSGLSYYFTRHFGVRANYLYRWRDGEIRMRNEGATRSTSQIESDVQEIQFGVIGRF